MDADELSAERDRFSEWYAQVEPQLRRALVAAYGAERGREATAEALAWAWEHPNRLASLHHPVSFLYRVGQSRSRRRLTRLVHPRNEWSDPWVEPQIGAALGSLSERQRVTVVLVHGYQWTVPEVAALLDIKPTTVENHLQRGLDKLRSHLGARTDG